MHTKRGKYPLYICINIYYQFKDFICYKVIYLSVPCCLAMHMGFPTLQLPLFCCSIPSLSINYAKSATSKSLALIQSLVKRNSQRNSYKDFDTKSEYTNAEKSDAVEKSALKFTIHFAVTSYIASTCKIDFYYIWCKTFIHILYNLYTYFMAVS